MKIIHDIRNDIELTQEAVQALTPTTLLVDIETTGLSRKYNPIYMIGCAYLDHSQIHLLQYFAESPAEEKEMLQAWIHDLSAFDRFITFNGDAFDLPYLIHRMEKHDLESPISDFTSLDLLKECRKHKKLLGLPSLRQKSIEQFLGIFREDTYSGGDLIEVYEQYAKDQDPEAGRLLLLHNYEDVLDMIPLLEMLRFNHMDQASFSAFTWEYDENDCIFSARSDLELPGSLRSHNDDYYLIIRGSQLKGALPLVRRRLYYYLPNPKDYYYLPDEDMVIPKVLGSTIDASRRKKARKENCRLAVDGTFVRLPHANCGKEGWKIFQENYSDKVCYVQVSEDESIPGLPSMDEVLESILTYIFLIL